MRDGAAAPLTPLAVRARLAAESVPVWVWLTGLVVLSIGVRIALALPNEGPWIFQDELAYWELATSFGHTGGFAIRDVPGAGGFGVVYPALISPATALFQSQPDAYIAAKGINALLMSLTALPVYFLARRFAGTALSLLAALLAVAVPGMVYTAAIMTENAFYPLIACFALALVLALENPTAVRQLALFAVIALAFFTRAQGAILVLVVLTAILAVALVDASSERIRPRSLLRALTRFNVTWLVLLGAALVVFVLQVARGIPPRDLLGAYEGVSDVELSPGEIARWFLYHLADLDLSVGLFPFGAFVVVLILALRSPRESRRFFVLAISAASLVFWFTLTVSAYAASPGADRIEERNLFHVVPVLFVVLVAWMARGMPRPVWAAGPAIAAMSALVVAIPSGDFLDAGNEKHSTFSLAPLWSFREHLGVSSADLTLAVALAGVAAGIVFAVTPRRLGLILPALVVVFFALSHAPVEGLTTQSARDELNAGIRVRPEGPTGALDRSWVDHAVGSSADVVWLWSSDVQWPLWETEFFNESIGRLYNLEGAVDGLPQQTATIDSNGFLRAPDGRAVEADYALAPASLVLEGALVTSDEAIGSELYRVAGPIKVAEQLDGVSIDRWAGPNVTYTRYGCTGGVLVVHLAGYEPLHPRPQTVVASIGGREVARASVPVGAVDARLRVPLGRSDGRCVVHFVTTPTAVPAEVLPSTDTRELGVQFVSFDYEPGKA